ncbi:hypothetical protein GF327_01805 [Candidatus Woesearchaeota archaeon]|nr:hypothetical protein [Candidatus Woesearchaeota archaeon]
MKKIIGILAIFLISIVSAVSTPVSTDSDIFPGVVAMEPNDSVDVEYCVVYIDENDAETPAVGLDVATDKICKDQNSIPGCQAADTSSPAEFSVTVVDSVTGADGCATLTLSTTNAYGGTFYYEVNGEVEGEAITEETGTAYIPEFGVLASLAVLGLAGLFVARKRK